MPSTLVRMTNVLQSIMAAMSPDNSSLSVNISSVTLTVSFSLTIGMTPLASITLMHAL